jgi:glycosyltransferase involved in cell wall biosynthesis
MRVLMASWVPQRREGGVAGVIHSLARELERRGHHVETLFREDLLPQAGPRRLDETVFAARLCWVILRRRDEFDVVNIHAPNGFVYGMLRKLFHPAGTPPYVATLHGLEERRAQVFRLALRQGLLADFGWKKRVWHWVYRRPIFRWSILTANASMILNREAWSYTLLRNGLNPATVWYVPNGVEERFFLPREYPQPVAPRLLFVGTWLELRGGCFLAEALRKFSRKYPDVRLTIAGSSKLEDTVRRSFSPEVQGCVTVLPFVPASDMPALYAAHDIFVFPSLMEGLPLALLEAMASGMPVVTTDTCGMPDAVKDGFNGLLVPPADSKALLDALTRLVESQALREALGRNAAASMRAFTWDRIAERVEKVLTLAVERSNRRR